MAGDDGGTSGDDETDGKIGCEPECNEGEQSGR
ncbi:hypothetical protein SAMN05421858_0810 [Haladaptatus litoreus]|uniref:Uncharacterized protein n=1 Tax=Haladaptatus litoreus TaxID=553468 RepID=A0A1N6WP22_9EURY|nr:hypothetical protein SAMN05421858_0810 [Haladaptatus litoreus]